MAVDGNVPASKTVAKGERGWKGTAFKLNDETNG